MSTHSIDLQIMQLEANFIQVFDEMPQVFNNYGEVFLQLDFKESNIEMLQNFYDGLKSIGTAVEAVTEAFQALCECKNLKVG